MIDYNHLRNEYDLPCENCEYYLYEYSLNTILSDATHPTCQYLRVDNEERQSRICLHLLYSRMK